MMADRGSCGDHVIEIDTVKEAAKDLRDELLKAARLIHDFHDNTGRAFGGCRDEGCERRWLLLMRADQGGDS